MAPVKFGDLAKIATEVLDDDYHTDGYQLKAKQNTAFRGASATTAVDLWTATEKTPAKITWKIPKPFNVAGISIDKLEMNKAGNYAAEAAFTDAFHAVKGLSVTVKSDLVKLENVQKSITYTGVPDFRVQVDTKTLKPADSTLELTTSALPKFTFGAKMSPTKDKLPNLGFRFASGPIFLALVSSSDLNVFKGHSAFNVNKDLKFAGSVEHNLKGKDSPKMCAGFYYNLAAYDLKLKAKASQDKTVSVSAKAQLAKGFNVLAGAKYNQAKKATFGLQVSIE